MFTNVRLSTIAIGAVLAVSSLATNGAIGQTFCSEPLEPVCFGTPPDPQNELQVTRCLQDAEEYEAAVEEYTVCVQDNLATWREEADAAIVDIRCALQTPDDADCLAGEETAESDD